MTIGLARRSTLLLVGSVALLAELGACSSGKPKHVEDATSGAGTASGSTADSGAGSSSSGSSASGSSASGSSGSSGSSPTAQTGDVQIRVEWPKMPLAARVSPGSSACKTPLVAQVSPTTTWGIPDVVVFVDGAPPARTTANAASGTSGNGPSSNASNAHETRVVIDRCAVMPRIAIGSRIAIASAADRPLEATLAKRFAISEPKRAIKATPIGIALPIAGHEVTTELEADAIYRVAPNGKDIDDGWIVGATAFITDATGVASIKDVPPGKHAVRVWLPPRGGQPAREAKGEVTVEAGDLAELTLALE